MKIPSVARYKYCCKKANEFLIKEHINKLPFDADKIIMKHKWAKLKYSALAKDHNVKISDIVNAYNSEDGYSIYTGNNYAIAYNDKISTTQRIYFTKLHEIGHIYLGHFKDFEATILNRSNLTDCEYKVLENEANCFARNILLPASLILELKIVNKQVLSSMFDITLPAVKARLELLKYDLMDFSENDLNIQRKNFYEFINKKYCLNCGYTFISKDVKYCPICGAIKMERGDSKMHYRKGIELDSNNHAVICPKCGNEDIKPTDLRCPICNAHLIQECDDETYDDSYGNEIISAHRCGNKTMDSNARYCPICGNKTTFYNHGYLQDWEVEREDIEREEAEKQAAISIANGDIPF